MLDALFGLPFTILVAVFVLGVLIFVHELGHFLAAKAVGIGVPRFSMGLGPVTPLRWKFGETEYVVSWIPFGGYVKMASAEGGEDGMVDALEGGKDAEGYPPEKLFENKPLWARILVIVAGVTMNALFAWVVFSALAFTYGSVEDATTTIAFEAEGLPPEAGGLTGIPVGARVIRINGDTIKSLQDIVEAIADPRSDGLRFEFDRAAPIDVPISGSDLEDRMAVAARIVPLQRPIVDLVNAGSPANRAGMRPGDEIIRFNGDTVHSWAQMVSGIETSAGDSITLTVARTDGIVSLMMVPDSSVKEGRTGKVGMIGVGGQRGPLIREHYGLGESIVQGGKDTGMAVVQVWAAVKGLVLRQISARNLGGVLQIGQMSGEMARLGWEKLLGLMAFLSVNLAVLNLLPIPVLDGGHLMFLLAEGVKGKPVSMAVRLRLSQVGLVFLIGLMLFALTNDVMRLMGK